MIIMNIVKKILSFCRLSWNNLTRDSPTTSVVSADHVSGESGHICRSVQPGLYVWYMLWVLSLQRLPCTNLEYLMKSLRVTLSRWRAIHPGHWSPMRFAKPYTNAASHLCLFISKTVLTVKLFWVSGSLKTWNIASFPFLDGNRFTFGCEPDSAMAGQV